MKRLLIGMFAIVLCAFVSASAATTTTTTNRGEVIVVKTLGNVATDAADETDFQDWSLYSTKPGQPGTIVRWYDFAVQGGAVGTVYLLPKVKIPDNALIRDGFIVVTTAIAPIVGATHSLSLESAADMKAAATNNLTATGIKATVPVGTAGTSVQLTDDRYLTMTIADTAVTAGKFMVQLDYVMAP